MTRFFFCYLGSLGDTLLVTPTLRAIKEAFPSAHTTIMVSPKTKDLFEYSPFVDQILYYQKGKTTLTSILRAVWGRDCALFLSNNYKAELFAWVSRVGSRVGKGTKPNRFFTKTLPLPTSTERYEADSFLDITRSLGIDTNDLSLAMPP